ncbi:hypothetical protein CBR_g38501 [Chara braunii]|uniref:Reverse transcriptase RNase H-like domain-containing protein n=1 Tax=Chara braunii TaxID=69332 RepID=A0A388JNW2_CHABU|nr:hypothetical protein CBR_g38501 [Chara braunii]|eukprot:GBG59477.1 hypothetical protein CBR_g38501 [Chara braunii]
MLGRWAVRLQEYDFDIVHRKTERHGNADGLTRLHRPTKFFSTTGVYAAAEFRFAAHSRTLVLAEASAYRRLSALGVSHRSTVVVFSGDINALDPTRHTIIQKSLREWCEQLAQEWSRWLARHNDNLIVTNNVDVGGLRTEHRTARESVELRFIQTWRTEVEGDLLGFIFGAVEPGHRQTIVWELTIPFAQLVNDLPLDIISQCDESPVPHVLSRRLTPYLQWSACLEDRTGGGSYPLRAEYLNPRGIIDVLFFSSRTAVEERVVAEEAEVEDESEEETTEEEGSYSKYCKEESGAESEKEEEEEDQLEEEEGSEWETLREEADHAESQEEDHEAAASQREEIAAGKQPLEYASGADLPIPNDPTKDPEPPKNDNGDSAVENSSAPAHSQRSRSPSPSSRPPVRTRVDVGHRASSPVVIPPSP